jgi:hypothetical protein
MHYICAVGHQTGCRVRGVPFRCPMCRADLPAPERPPLNAVPEFSQYLTDTRAVLDNVARLWLAANEPDFEELHPLPRDIDTKELKDTIEAKRKHLLRDRDALVRKLNSWWAGQRKNAHEHRRRVGKHLRKLALLNLALHHQPTEAAFQGRNLDAEDAEIDGDDD